MAASSPQYSERDTVSRTGRRLLPAVVAAMTVMHEKMHQRASEKRQPDKRTKQMRPVLRPQIDPADRQEGDQHQPGRRQ